MIHIRILKHLLQCSILLVATACVTANIDSYDENEHGIVVGSIGFIVSGDELATVREMKLSIKPENGIFSQLELYVSENDSNQQQFFVHSFKPGVYELNDFSIATAGVTLVPKKKPSLSFAIEKGKVTYIGLVQIELTASRKTYAVTIDKKAIINGIFGQQNEHFIQLYERYPHLVSLPIIIESVISKPYKIVLVDASKCREIKCLI